MRITLTPTQEGASNEITARVVEELKKNSNCSKLTFYAPTGSGKTVIMGKSIEKIIDESRDALAFMWLSIGKGGLHLQSLKKLQNILREDVRCGLLERGRSCVNKNEIAVLNWERINRKTNNLLEDGDHVGFDSICDNTRELRKLCLIIDESHTNNTENSHGIIDRINPDMIIGMSATPLENPDIRITYDEMIEEEVVKKQVIINEGIERFLDEHSDTDKLHIILEIANKKREYLKKLYEENDDNINPLCIIQVPNKDRGDARIDSCKRFFARKGITEENGKFAIWITNREGNLIHATEGFDKELLRENDGKIEVLVFKQAVDTGWDCPRAHIWVKLRDIKSYIFSEQTLGRFLRMPNRKYYEEEDLNTGYVYTDDKSFKVKAGEFEPDIITWREANIKEGFNISLTKFHKKWDSRMLKQSFYRALDLMFCKELNIDGDSIEKNKSLLIEKGYDMSLSILRSSILGSESIELSDIENGEIYLEGNDLIGLNARVNIVEEFEDLVKTDLAKCEIADNSKSRAIGALRGWAEKYLGYSAKTNLDGVYSFFIRNWDDKFGMLLRIAIECYKPFRIIEKSQNRPESKLWEPLSVESYNGNSYEEVPHHNYAYDPCYLRKDRSQLEKDFEKFIDRSDFIDKWLKNGDKGNRYFAIPYKKNNEILLTYPDYIIKFKNGLVGIFDTKGGQNAEASKEKAEGLSEYIEERINKGEKLIGGITAQNKFGNWKIWRSGEYHYDNKLDDWENFSEFLNNISNN